MSNDEDAKKKLYESDCCNLNENAKINLDFMESDDEELYRCDNNDMRKLNLIRKELNLPELQIEQTSHIQLQPDEIKTSLIKVRNELEKKLSDFEAQQFINKLKDFRMKLTKSLDETQNNINLVVSSNVEVVRIEDVIFKVAQVRNVEETQEFVILDNQKPTHSKSQDLLKKVTTSFRRFLSKSRVAPELVELETFKQDECELVRSTNIMKVFRNDSVTNQIYFNPSESKLAETKILYKSTAADLNDSEENLLPVGETAGRVSAVQSILDRELVSSLNVPSKEQQEKKLVKSVTILKDLTGKSVEKSHLVYHVSGIEQMVSLDVPKKYQESFNFPSIAYIYQWHNLASLASQFDVKLSERIDLIQTRRRINEKLAEISQLEELYTFSEKQKPELDKAINLKKFELPPKLQLETDVDEEEEEIFSIISTGSYLDANVQSNRHASCNLCCCFRRN